MTKAKYSAKVNRFGHVEIYRARLYNGEVINDCPLYLQAEADTQAFSESLNAESYTDLMEGYEVKLGRKEDNPMIEALLEDK